MNAYYHQAPEVRAGCGNPARPDLCGGRPERAVPTATGELTSPVAVTVAPGRLLSKPIGIVLFSYLAVRFGIAKLPTGVNWRVMLGGSWLAGIGFKMSLFVANLALGSDAHLLAAGKIGTLTGSVCSAILETVVLVVLRGRRK